MWYTAWTIQGLIPGMGGDFSLLQNVPTSSEGHAVTYSMCAGGPLIHR